VSDNGKVVCIATGERYEEPDESGAPKRYRYEKPLPRETGAIHGSAEIEGVLLALCEGGVYGWSRKYGEWVRIVTAPVRQVAEDEEYE